jgi:hypothetical protein
MPTQPPQTVGATDGVIMAAIMTSRHHPYVAALMVDAALDIRSLPSRAHLGLAHGPC